MTPFDYLNDIMQSKKNIADDSFEKDYNPFLINVGLSHHEDCVIFANEMNRRHFISKNSQYLFLLNTIRAKKRKFSKWYKPEKNDDLDVVKLYFGLSEMKAREIIDLIGDDNMKKIKELTDKGGIK